MAIVKSASGKFYDVDDNVLESKEVKREDLPKEMQQSGPPPGMGGGAPGLAGLIQVIVNVPGGGGPPGGGADKPGESGESAEGDVAGHHWWHNHWHNCWQNHHHHWHNW